MTDTQNTTLAATLEFLDQAAERLAEAGADDPGSNYTFGMPETDTAAQDMDLAVQLVRRAQDRLAEWEETDLRALAARLILEKGVGYCDVEDTDDEIYRMAEEEFPSNNALQPLHLDAVRDMMRRSVIEIDGVRYNDGLERTDHRHPVNPASAVHQPEWAKKTPTLGDLGRAPGSL